MNLVKFWKESKLYFMRNLGNLGLPEKSISV